MKKRIIAIISALLALSMTGAVFASCTPGGVTNDPQESESESTSQTDPEENSSESDKNNSGDETEDGPMLDCDNALSIEYANSILNGVNYYYPDYKRETAVIENQEMMLEYGLLTDGNKQVQSLKNKNGVPYVENTMDVFVRMNSGDTYYASTTKVSTTSNLFRLGYYFYEARFEGQDFLNGVEPSLIKKVNLSNGISGANDTKLVSNENGELSFELVNDKNGVFDPYVLFADGSHTSKKDNPFTLIEITMKAGAGIRECQLYVNTGAGINNDQRYGFALIADGQYHTYTIPLYAIQGYVGKTTGLRLDFNGKDTNTCTIKEMNLVAMDMTNLPAALSIARSFMTYSDKMHHVLQVSAQAETSNIKEIGMLTEIRKDTVEKLIVKDASGTHDTIDGIDWATVEYIGFDIKNAGIFGYILPYDNNSGSLNVTLKDGMYVIEQTETPEGGIIKPSEEGTVNANDFYMGQRIYTDDNHDFTEFLTEAEFERNPISSNFIKVDTNASDEGSYLGYDALRGIYIFKYKCITAGSNDYPNVKFSVKGEGPDRKIYVMAYSDSSSVVESTVVLNEKDFLLPIPVEVGKNFSEAAGERNLYNIDDPVYSESIFPLVIKNGEMKRYNIINIYRKWGNFPLKQVSWIQFYAPYYHLSTGVTETNCIVPWYATRISRDLNTLPDFRSMSAPPFSGDQKNSGGTHRFLKYTDADGNYITSENTINTIGSYGPTYADVTMDYLSDDGKIKITYNHMEMPQDDENRTYYEMKYEILEDVTIKDFAKDFSFYSVCPNDPTGVYTLLGYLGEDNESKVVDAKMAGDDAAYYVLGKNAPYFSYMKMTEDRSNKSGYINLAFLVHSSEFIIGGEKVEPNFILSDLGGTLSISLNYGELTLKKGDKITINAILLPWGSQETIYDGSNGLAPDQNVRDVRQNTILDPFKVTAVADCEVIETVYVPMLKTTNGKSAEFTLSGGHNNCAIRIYGFDMLTAPKVYELINDEWIPYRLASGYYSYNTNTSRTFDGYGVNYDGDGTFSYSFVAEINNGKARTFKIVADQKFSSWQEIDKDDVVSNYIDPASKYSMSKNAFVFHTDFINGIKNAINSTSSSIKELDFEGDTSLPANKILTISGWAMVQNGVSNYLWSVDGKDWFDCKFTSSNKLANCGQAIINASNTTNTGYTFTESDAVGGGLSGGNALAIDLSKYSGQTIKVYIAAMPQGSVDEICVFTVINNIFVSSAPTPEPENKNDYISYDSPYDPSDNAYIAHIDSVNGIKSSINSVSTSGVKSISFTSDMIKGTKLNVAGWAMIESGVSKYVWSINGKDWFDCGILKNTDYGNCGSSIISAANSTLGGVYTFTDTDAVKGGFQADSTLVIDLTDKFNGTVNVTIAAVPADSEKELCIITQIKGVSFTTVDPDGYTSADKFFVFHVDKINGKMENASGTKYSYNSVSNKKMVNLELNENTVSSADSTKPGTELIVGGWTVLQGGISKFLWSVDGKNWYDCKANLTSCSQTVLSAASGMMGGAYTYTTVDGTNGQYSIIIDLKGYAGQTVNVQIAAVLENGDGTTICVLSSINGVTVSAN